MDIKRPSPDKCPLCGSASFETRHQNVKRFKRTYDVYKCNGCGLGITQPFPDKEQLADVYASTSYRYNANDLTNGAGPGSNPAFQPYSPDDNTFQVDQVWFEIGKPVTEESRAGSGAQHRARTPTPIGRSKPKGVRRARCVTGGATHS